MKTRLFSILPAIFLSLSLSGQTVDVSKPILSSSDVENFIKNYKPLDSALEKLNIDHSADADFQSFIQGLQSSAEVNQAVRKYGYSDVNDFVSKALAISFSYLSIKMESKGSPDLDKALKEIDDNKNMTPDQKEEQKAQTKQLMGAMSSAFSSMVNKQDVETVRPYLSQLAEVFKNQMDQ